mmetsp:Transcript_97967/g.277092  ORF Transcript_97967/g.277092 Transcript_97967/m.277092 type:complete len:346 (-) Transcript_97967:7-1044(-)
MSVHRGENTFNSCLRFFSTLGGGSGIGPGGLRSSADDAEDVVKIPGAGEGVRSSTCSILDERAGRFPSRPRNGRSRQLTSCRKPPCLWKYRRWTTGPRKEEALMQPWLLQPFGTRQIIPSSPTGKPLVRRSSLMPFEVLFRSTSMSPRMLLCSTRNQNGMGKRLIYLSIIGYAGMPRHVATAEASQRRHAPTSSIWLWLKCNSRNGMPRKAASSMKLAKSNAALSVKPWFISLMESTWASIALTSSRTARTPSSPRAGALVVPSESFKLKLSSYSRPAELHVSLWRQSNTPCPRPLPFQTCKASFASLQEPFQLSQADDPVVAVAGYHEEPRMTSETAGACKGSI